MSWYKFSLIFLVSTIFITALLTGCTFKSIPVKLPAHEVVQKKKPLYMLDVELPSNIPAGKRIAIKINILDAATSKPATDLKQDSIAHLTFVSRSLHRYQHIHTKIDNWGTVKAQVKFLKSGQNLMYVQFSTRTHGDQILLYSFDVDGGQEFPPNFIPFESPTDHVGSYQLSLTSKPLRAGLPGKLEVKIQRNKKDVSVEPYMDEPAHVTLINQETLELIPLHPVAVNLGLRHRKREFLTPLTMDTNLQNPGGYKLWLEFQKNNKIYISRFTFSICNQSCVEY